MNDQLSADRLLSFVKIFKINSNLNAFQEWMKEYHKRGDESEIFEGYKFFLDVCIRGFINSVIYESALDLEEDFTFFRARFVGIELDDIPNTCEKTIFIKNIWNLTTKIRKAKRWDDLNEAVETVTGLVTVFDMFLEKNICQTTELNENNALKIVTKFYTHIFLNNTREGIPHVYLLTPILKFTATEKYLEKAYLGYVYALQYLWFVLLGKTKFEETSLRKMHMAHEIYSNGVEEQIETMVGMPVSEDVDRTKFERLGKPESEILSMEESFEKDINKLEEGKKRPTLLKNWLALDKFFAIIHEEIIVPIEDQIKLDIRFNPLFKVTNKFNKSLFTKYLSTEELRNPKYLEPTNNNQLMKKKLDFLFYWYDINVLDTQKLTVFNGVPSFISTLIGNVELNRIFGHNETVYVLRFKYPVKDVQGYDYSYGIFIPTFGSMGLTDYSGWLIFFDCATDYSGFGGSLHTQAEMIINKLLEESKIKIKTEIVNKNFFKEYLAEKSISSVFDKIKLKTPYGMDTELSISEIQKHTEIFIADMKGKLFEYVFYHWLLEENSTNYHEIKCDVNKNKEQIDVYAELEDEIHIFECKVNLHDNKIDETINQINRKVKALQLCDNKIIPRLIVFSEIKDASKKRFKDEGIDVFDNFEDEIQSWRYLNSDSTKTIFSILKFKFNSTVGDIT
ncbi:MAG: hypothetical protein ACTSX0_03890 [Promethearchaeota archaeon]